MSQYIWKGFPELTSGFTTQYNPLLEPGNFDFIALAEGAARSGLLPSALAFIPYPIAIIL